MHGALQEVPLETLPLPRAVRSARRLGDVTVVSYGFSGGRASRDGPAPPIEASARLFLVDPTSDLAAGASLGNFYRRIFPGARLFEGARATVAALRDNLPSARWLHVDAHARYDPAFPELTELVMADGPLTARELLAASPSLELANLSACHSGRWPVTAGSGRFGLAGLLASRGAAWVVGTRADLDDGLAGDFNQGFYEALAGGRTVPAAYGAAMARVRERHAISRWASLLLLQAAPLPLTGGNPVRAGLPP